MAPKKHRACDAILCASDEDIFIGGYRVFLVAIEGFVYQVVELNHRCIQIMSGKCDQVFVCLPNDIF